MDYRKLVEAVLGRKLLPTEVVHHINGNHKDSRIDNLYVYDSKQRHTVYHIKFGTLAMRLINCYEDKCILGYVKRVLMPMIKVSNINELIRENESARKRF